MDTATVKRTFFPRHRDAASSGVNPTSVTAAALGAQDVLSPSCSSSSTYSPAMLGTATPRRQKRSGSVSALVATSSAMGGGAASSVSSMSSSPAADGDGRPSRQETSMEGSTRFLPSASSSPYSVAQVDTPSSLVGRRFSDETRHHHHPCSSNGSNHINGGGTLAGNCYVDSSSSACARLWGRTTQRLLWIFWRRREMVNLRARLRHRSVRLLRHYWGRRIVTGAAVIFVALFWFRVITAVAGPAGNSGGGRSIGGGKGGGKRRQPGGSHNSKPQPSYYQRIVGEVAVGPSLMDPWKVREINIATADWGLGLKGAYDDIGGSGGDSRNIIGGKSTSREEAVVEPREGQGAKFGRDSKREEGWDGRINRVITGELEPVGTKTRPKVDLLLTIFSGTTETDAAKRDLLRQIYDKYEGWIRVGGPNSITGGTNPEEKEFTVSLVFVLSKPSAPPEGELVGDILYVPVPEGYRNIVLKTKAMLVLVRHFDFQYLLKADDDSFVCLTRVASMLHDLDPRLSNRIYAGVPTACNQSTNPDYWNGRVMKDPDHRWFDNKYLQHTLGGLDCFPAYMQGAFYILAQPLVEHLYRGHEHLECFTNEDVTIGSWLMGVDREMVEMYDLQSSHIWDCLCARTQITTQTRRNHMFFHNCKGMSQLKLCATRLLRPGIGC